MSAPDPLTQTTNTNSEWPYPIPLIPELPSDTPYPTSALPNSLEKIVQTYHNYGKQPLPLIACSALANISLACQSMANVARDNHLVSPVSLYFLMVAHSGERKSAVDSLFSKSARSWEQDFRRTRAFEVQACQAMYSAWEMEKDGLLSQIKRTAYAGEDTDSLKSQLSEIMKEEPNIPLLPTLYFEDATQEALANHLAQGWPSASLWSDEAGIIIGSHSMQANATRFVALLNRLWDGKTFTAHRKTSKSFSIEDRRLTVNLMMQPLLLEQLSSMSSGVHRQSGFLARCLMAYPSSSMGSRFYQEPPTRFEHLDEYSNRIHDCLQHSRSLTKNGCHDLPILRLSPSAKKNWIQFFNHTESGVSKQGQWSNIKDFASKAPENAARLAALFNLFNGQESDVTADNMDSAIAIIEWHLQETRRILSIEPKTNHVKNAQKLIDWLTSNDKYMITPREIQQLSPIRDKAQRDSTLEILIEHQMIKLEKIEGTTFVKVNPNC